MDNVRPSDVAELQLSSILGSMLWEIRVLVHKRWEGHVLPTPGLG